MPTKMIKTNGIMKVASFTVILLVWWSQFVFTSASNDTLPHDNATDNSTDLQASSQYYRTYYYNRRPSYPSNYYGNNRRPVYATNYRPNYGITAQRPNYYPAAPTVPRPTSTKGQILAAIAAYTAGHFCNSAVAATSNQGPSGICWDSTNQKLRTDNNLTIEKFVSYFAGLQDANSLGENTRFRDQICEQSRRFNSAGIVCVPFKHIDYDSSWESQAEAECPPNAQTTSSCFGQNCICYVEQYRNFAEEQQGRYYRQFRKPLLDIELLSIINMHFPAWTLPHIYG